MLTVYKIFKSIPLLVKMPNIKKNQHRNKIKITEIYKNN